MKNADGMANSEDPDQIAPHLMHDIFKTTTIIIIMIMSLFKEETHS